ncbi:unnamed protein product, partial [Meganyctiphanes norvegica]
MDSSIVCSICLEEFNSTSHRPKNLPCSHNLCTPCLEDCFASGIKTCAVCRKPIGAISIDEIPFNTDLEKLLQYVSQLIQAQQNTDGFDTNTSAQGASDNSSAVKLHEDVGLHLVSDEGFQFSWEDEELQLALALSKSGIESKEGEEASYHINAEQLQEDEELKLALALSMSHDENKQEVNINKKEALIRRIPKLGGYTYNYKK